MKTMKKIVAILAVALMLCSILPLSAFAADATATITFDSTSKRTEYSTSKQVWVENGITVTNNKSASTSNVGNYSKPARFYKSSQLIVEYPGMTQIVFDCNSTSYATALKNSISGYTVAVSSDKVTVTFTEPVDSFTINSLTGGQVRMDGLTVTYTEGEANPDCDHDSLQCGEACAECGEFIQDHAWDNACDNECNNCGVANPNYADHVYDGDYDVACNVCGGEREVNFPEADSTLTIVEANTIGGGMTHNTFTTDKYYVTGVIVSIENADKYGNIYIQDEDGNQLYIYGTYSADGKTQFGSMEEKPVVGMTITVYGVIGFYSKAAQMKNGWITEMISNCEHVWDNNCDTTCDDCGFVREIEHDYVADIVESTCTEAGHASYECSVCGHSYDEELPLAAHNYVNDICSACGAQKPNGYAPITSADQFVSGQYVMVVSSGYAPTYINDANNPWVLRDLPVITDGVISADDAAGFLWTVTVDGTSVYLQDINGNYIAPKGGNNNGVKKGQYAWTWAFADGFFTFSGVDSDTVILASNTTTGDNGDNKFRGYKSTTVTGAPDTYLSQFTLYAASIPSAPACEHEYDNACDVDCNLCYETREVSHNVVHVAAVAATCAANGNIEHWYCDVCGMAWLDEACAQNTNLKAVKLPATGEHTYFDACSAICEACGYEREVSHNVIHVEAAAATCVANGNIEYWYCDVCGMAWLNAECTLNTNLRAVITPATGEHVYDDEYDADCNVCGDVREVPEKPVEIIYGDADGDGEITLLDANLLNQYLSEWEVTLDEAAADADGDGEITLLDANLLNQYLSEWDVVLGPVEDDSDEQFNDGELTEWPQ